MTYNQGHGFSQITVELGPNYVIWERVWSIVATLYTLSNDLLHGGINHCLVSLKFQIVPPELQIAFQQRYIGTWITLSAGLHCLHCI